MMRDFHVHTNFCDGKNSPEEMVEKAVSLGFEEIGLLHHSYTPFDQRYCIKRDKIDEFVDTVAELKQKYRDKIKIYCGVERDYYSIYDLSKFDYCLGSVHYVKKGEKYIEIDESKKILVDAVNDYYGGDVYALIEDYYKNVSCLCENGKVDIVGHFDLISKFNEKGDLFDENDDRYVNAWKSALDKLMMHVKTFEINFGAISRGYRSKPYPNEEQIEYILSHGGKFVFGSDSHSTANLEVDLLKFSNLFK